MTASPVRRLLSRSIPSPRLSIPSPRLPGDADAAHVATPTARNVAADIAPAAVPSGRAVAYQRLAHQLVRRELRLLADLAAWAPADDAGRTTALTRHAELVGRVLLHHHAVERELLWPALQRTVPADHRDSVRAAVADWAERCVHIDERLRDLATCARQWRVTAAPPARQSFLQACQHLADLFDAQTAEEERALFPLLAAHLDPADWTAISRAAGCRLATRERLLVVGLALEDACASDRARLLDGLPRPTRLAWQLSGRRRFLASVVRLRGAPPAR